MFLFVPLVDLLYTPALIRAQVVEVQNFEDLNALGREKVAGKIVFYNRPMDAKLINTFQAYSGAVNQRSRGATVAAKLGTVTLLCAQ